MNINYFPKVISADSCYFLYYYTIWIIIRYKWKNSEGTNTTEELDSYISEAINQLRSSKKQPNENVIFNLLSGKLKAIAINKEQLNEILNYLVAVNVLQSKPRNGLNSFYIINNQSESSKPSLTRSFPETPIIRDFSNAKLNDNDSDAAENNNHMCDNQV